MNKLSNKHYLFFILIVSSISLRSYSSVFINLGGRDTWIASIIAGIIYIAYVYFIIYVCKQTNSFDIKEIFKNTYPKTIGNILLFIFAFALFLTSVETAAVQSDSIHSTIFLETPIWYCLLFFIIPAGYLITRRIETLVIVIIITVILVFSSMFFVEVLTLKYHTFQYLLPFFELGVNRRFLLSILLILGSLSSTAITFPFLKYISKKDKILKYSTIGTIIIAIISTLSILSAISTFGPIRASNIYYPEFLRVQRIQLNGFIEFGDLFFISKTVSVWFLKYVLCAVAILYMYKNVFTNKKIFAIGYSFLAYICSYVISKKHYLLFDFLKYYELIALILLCILPFVTFLIYYLKYKKKSQINSNFKNKNNR